MITNNPLLGTTKFVLTFAFLHISIIALSNYLVQIPVEISGFYTTWGAFTFPIVFLLTDLTVRVVGQIAARKVVFYAMFPALLLSYYFSIFFFQGKFVSDASVFDVNLFVLRIVIASFSAYVVGQLLDIFVFDRLRRRKTWWVAPFFSSLLGNTIDAMVFFSIAFYRSSDTFMAENWVEIGLIDWMFKLMVSLVVFLPLYAVTLSNIESRLTKRAALTS